MAKPNPLQEQLLKAGLAKKSKVAEAARAQEKARHGKGPAESAEIQREAERARLEKVERDRALAAEQKARARASELLAQARQIIQDKKLPRAGDSEYRFTADGAIRTLLIDAEQRKQLASGAIVVARLGERYELLPRRAGDQVRERAPDLIVLDHGQPSDAPAASDEDDAYYAQFKVPDDLVW
ncbi:MULTISPECIES: DUF2058 domain-containing protein [Arenimonas]|uniref:Nucleoprotein/polynucleotide-associated enzyme n=1 Tax=Arenimonas metalli CF5-1 TaxID=1384056 RepID=A0A091B5N7_9GAMM|nr:MULTISPECIES: DUF2058 domain-containing protein [Arenimonas]KFN47021.1 hypothetical protein N787_01605 [Arenimonas metalli CF5-1]HEX4853564.1 DUF2058 domain-containing protein [Arenimonas sp.]